MSQRKPKPPVRARHSTAPAGPRIRCRTASPSLLRIAVPYFPGWRATAGAKSLPLLRVDHALMGVVIPKGESEVVLQFRSNYFVAGAALSLLGLFVVSAGFGAFVWRSSGFAGRLSSRPRLFRF